jgi:O-antigen/teichoic acid export membrane protein
MNDFSLRTIMANAGALFSGTAVARILSALVIFVTARRLGPDAFGLYIACLSLAKLTSIFFSLGLDSWMLRDGSRNPEQLPSRIGASLAIKTTLGLGWMVVLVAAGPYINQQVFPGYLLFLAALSTWLDELASSAWSAFKAVLRNTITVWLLLVSQILLLAFTIWLATRPTDDAALYLLIRVLASALGAGVSLWSLARHFGISLKWKAIQLAGRETIPFGLSHGLAVIYERADVTIIAYWLGKTAVGFYAPAVSLMTTLFLIPFALYEVMLPIFARLHRHQPEGVPPASFRLVAGSALLGTVLGLAMSLMAHPLVWLVYGPEFALSGEILVILSSILVFKCVTFALGAVLVAVGRQAQRVQVQAVVAGLNVVINVLLIQSYGLLGVAYVYVLTEALLMFGYAAFLLQWQHKEQSLAIGKSER